MGQQNAPQDLNGIGATFGKKLPEQAAYAITPSNWYKSLPYGFAFWDIDSKGGDKAASTIYLPISPNNLIINTSFATNVITTLYGIVEEHSEVRYYDILIQGTTGFAPRFIGEWKSGAKVSDFQSTGRDSFIAQGLDFGGFLPEVTNTINQVLNTANEIGNTLNGGPSNPTGIDPNKSGYVAFHNLYRFFLKYKNDAAQVSAAANTQPVAIPVSLPIDTKPKRKTHPIQFLNYKDGVKYDCIPLSFTMTRSVDSPMIYNYSIKLRGFNLQNVSAVGVKEADQLAKFGLGGLDGQSLFSKMTSIAGNASTLVSAII